MNPSSRSSRSSYRTLAGLSLLVLLGSPPPAAASAFSPPPDIRPLQELMNQGKAQEAVDKLSALLEKYPDNARLLYDLGVAAYAAGKFEDALIALDRAEQLGGSGIANKVKFQKGNAEFRIGSASRTANLDETVARWKESLHHFADALKVSEDPLARRNFEFVRRQLLDLLMADAKRNMEASKDPVNSPLQKIDKLRNAFEKYSDAKEIAPSDPDANAGESEARDQLANALAREGTRKSQSTRLVSPKPTEAPIPRPDYKEIEEGVAMLEDAVQLKPKDEGFKQALEDAKRRLADALTFHARTLMLQEQQMPWPNEKLAVLRMAREQVEKALDKVPDHQPAKDTLEAIKQRLADVMEERADELVQQSEQANLEQQTQALGQSLDFYQQASELKPKEARLPQKAAATQEKLEKALSKLADKLSQDPQGKESLESKAARLEGAEQALDELQGLKPSKETGDKAAEVGKKLDEVRQKLSEQAQKGQSQQPGGKQPQMAQGEPQNQGVPIDAPPRINTPAQKGRWSSKEMMKKQDY